MMQAQTTSFENYPALNSLPVFNERIIADNANHFYSLQPAATGIYQSLEAMAACVRGEIAPDYAGFDNPKVCQKLQEIQLADWANSPEMAIFNYCQNQIDFVLHPPEMQIVQDALVTIEKGSGDCVSKSVLLATLLAAACVPVWFVTQNVDGQEFSHVYCEAVVDGKLMALDSSANHPAGWRQLLQPAGFETTWLIF